MRARRPAGPTRSDPGPTQKRWGLARPNYIGPLVKSEVGPTGPTLFPKKHHKKQKGQNRGVSGTGEKECSLWVGPPGPQDISADSCKGNSGPVVGQEVRPGPTPITIHIPLRTGRGLNDRESRFARSERVKKERKAVWACWWRRSALQVKFPVEVLLVRISPGHVELDDDNLRGSLKAVRDQVADELGVNDGDRAKVRFDYHQERGPWGVRVQLQEAP